MARRRLKHKQPPPPPDLSADLPRTAQTSRSFRRIVFTTRTNPPSPARVRFTPSPPSTTTKAATSPPRSALRKSNTSVRQRFSAASSTSRITPSVNVSFMPAPAPQRRLQPLLIDLMEETPTASSSTSPASSVSPVAQATIMPQEVKESPPKATTFTNLVEPRYRLKQEVAQLAAAVLRSNLVPVTARIWHTFGFVTINDVEEERHLAGLYAIILEEAVHKQ
ncbi:hypothetical protein IQ06DRAFT_354372 [Phaeosphaeriaceae sp. SRC1lsM3a]|nr:hypothetical protein IQ06DRAFT_354372 [Stagonospora sp. SRC1lsM3a]